jgi:hypothetical protein
LEVDVIADRKASVALELQAGQFKAEATVVEKKIDDLDDAVEELDHDITRIPSDAAKAGAALKLLGGDINSVGDKIGSLGEKQTGLATLDAKIRTTRSEVRKLSDEFVKTNDVDVFKKLSDASGRLDALQAVRKKLASTVVDGVEDGAKQIPKTLAKAGAEGGTQFGRTFFASVQGALSTAGLGPVLIAALSPAILGAAVFLGAAAGGALLAGTGGAVAAGGLAGAWLGDPERFQSEWNASIDKVQHRWLASSAAFGNELEDVLRVVDRMLVDLPIEKVLAISQSFVGPLAGGAAGGITAFANGLADALGKVQPIVDRIGPKLEMLGHAAGDALRMISMGADQGGQALGDLLDVVGFLIRATGLLILGFELTYGALRDLVTGMVEFEQSIPVIGDAVGALWGSLTNIERTSISAGKAIGDTGAEASNTAFRFGDMIAAGAELAIAALDANDALTELHNTLLASANANLAVAQGWLDLKKGLEDGARTLDTTSQAGIDNNQVIISQIGLLEQQRQQAIKTGGGTVEAIDAANAAYNASIEKLRQAAYAAHFNKDQVDALIASLGAVPAVTTAAVVTPGLGAALEQGISLGNALNRIDGDYYARVHVSGLQAGTSLGNLLHHAGGGPVYGGVPSIVGERGPELFIPNVSGQIVPNDQMGRYANMRSVASIPSGGGGGRPGAVAVEVSFAGSGRFGTLLAQTLQEMQRTGQLQLTAR